MNSVSKRKRKHKKTTGPSDKKSKVFANQQIESLRKTSETKNLNDTVDPELNPDTGVDADAFAEDFFKSEESDESEKLPQKIEQPS